MNETRRKPTTGTRCPALFEKWHGIFYVLSRTDTAGHTKAFIYQVMDHWGESQGALTQGRCGRPVGPQSNTPTTRPRWPPEVGRSIIPRVLNGGGDLLPIGGSSAKTAPPHVGHPQGALGVKYTPCTLPDFYPMVSWMKMQPIYTPCIYTERIKVTWHQMDWYNLACIFTYLTENETAVYNRNANYMLKYIKIT